MSTYRLYCTVLFLKSTYGLYCTEWFCMFPYEFAMRNIIPYVNIWSILHSMNLYLDTWFILHDMILYVKKWLHVSRCGSYYAIWLHMLPYGLIMRNIVLRWHLVYIFRNMVSYANTWPLNLTLHENDNNKPPYINDRIYECMNNVKLSNVNCDTKVLFLMYPSRHLTAQS